MEGAIRISIPRKFKEQLEARFNPELAVLEGKRYAIKVECSLCKEYGNTDRGCRACPLGPPLWEYEMTCGDWLRGVMEDDEIIFVSVEGISWDADHDKEAREILQRFRARARKLVKWVPN